MQLSFHGATREVTGSCYAVENDHMKILVDCGMYQGSAFADAKNFKDFSFDPSTIDSVIITHAHLDHIGRLPKLHKAGFRGTVYATPPTAKLMKIVLEDAEQVMEDDFRREYRPKLFERKDVDDVMKLVTPMDYDRRKKLDGFSFRFRDAGHILGSSFVELEESGGPRIAFSGDLGNSPDPILRPTAQLAEQDALIIESTYGNRLHEEISERSAQLQRAIETTIKNKGVLVVPAFAIERTQELLFEMNEMIEHKSLPRVDVYLDSPLAIRASDIMQDFTEYFNAEAKSHVMSGDDLFSFPGLHKTLTREDSKGINEAPWPKIIIAGAGMMNGGRILHHLVRYLGNANCTVLIIGFQARGTLGQRLYSGERRVEVLGERIHVKANIISIGAYSAHADQRQILNWIGSAAHLPKSVYCTHGEESASAALASRIEEELHIPSSVPRPEQHIQL